MWKLLQYYGKYQSARGVLGGMPSWARLILLIAALPGLVLLALSLLVFGVSILALLLLTVPVYRVLKGLTGAASQDQPEEEVPAAGRVDFVEPAEPVQPSVVVSEVPPPAEPERQRRQIEVRIIE
jgi:hypothetical protein